MKPTFKAGEALLVSSNSSPDWNSVCGCGKTASQWPPEVLHPTQVFHEAGRTDTGYEIFCTLKMEKKKRNNNRRRRKSRRVMGEGGDEDGEIMRTTTIIKQQGSLCCHLLPYLASTSAWIASTVGDHYCISEIVLGSKSSVFLVFTNWAQAGWALGDSGCGFLAQCQAHRVTHSFIGGRDYRVHQENKRRSSGHSPPK